MIEKVLADNLDVLLYLVGSFLLIGAVFGLLYYKLKEDAAECDCAPTVLRSQDGGYVTKIYHLPLCRHRKELNGQGSR
jgi:hypothetical protein